MPDFIDKFIFNPNSLSIIEFLANYFISLLSTVMPFFLLIAIGVAMFAWLSQGFDKRELIEKFVQISFALSLTSLLLFTPGRKTIQLDASTTTQSYLIIDTLNDFLVLGNRLGDALAYNMLFGFNYNGSDQPLFEFDKDNIFQLKNYNLTPNGEDYVDGFFVSGLLNLVTKNITKNYINSTLIKSKIKNKYKSDLVTIRKVDKILKNFIKSKDFLKTENFFKEKNYFDNLLDNNIKKAIEKKQLANIKLNLKNIDENLKLTELDYINTYNETVKNIPFKYEHNFYNLKINLTNPTNNEITIKKYIYTLSSHPTRYQIIDNTYILNNDLLVNKNIVKKEIIKIIYKDSQIKGIETINKFLNKNNLKESSFNVTNETNYIRNYNNLYSEMLNFFNKPKYNSEYKLLTKNNFNLTEVKNFIDLYFSYLKYKQTIIIGKMFNPNNGYKVKPDFKTQDLIFKDRFNFLIESLANNFKTNDNEINDIGLTIQTKAYAIYNLNLNNSLNMSEEQIKKVLLRVNQQSYDTNYAIGANYLKKNGNGYYKLKYLSNDFLLKNEINNLLPKFAEINLDNYKKKDTTPFHWYNLNQYATGLKNLFLQNNSFYSNMGVYQETITANTLLATCLPIYQNIIIQKKTVADLSDDIKDLCFPKKAKMNSSAKTFAKLVAWYEGIKVGIKTTSYMTKTLNFATAGKKDTKGVLIKGLVSVFIGIGSGITIGYFVFVLIYTMLIYLFFLIPTVFIFIAVVSWIIRASMALIFFGFSIILFLFTQKKDRLIENFYTFSMYILMPLFLTFIIFLIIHLSFVISITINNLIPEIAANNYILGKNSSEVIDQIVNNPTLLNESKWYKILDYFTSVKDAVFAGDTWKIIVAGIYNLIIEQIKFIIIIIIEIALYIKLWRVDQFINEIIATNVKSAELSPERLIHMFGGSKAGNLVRTLS